jgi:hypothetical protein
MSGIQAGFLHSRQIAIYFIVIYNEIEERKVWGPRRTYLSNKKKTLPSSVVVLKIWMFRNHRLSTISNQVNPTGFGPELLLFSEEFKFLPLDEIITANPSRTSKKKKCKNF